MNSKKPLGHDLEKYSLYDKEKLCTVIYADLTDKTVFAEKTAGLTGLEQFPEYLTLIFEVDAFFSTMTATLTTLRSLRRTENIPTARYSTTVLHFCRTRSFRRWILNRKR